MRELALKTIQSAIIENLTAMHYTIRPDLLQALRQAKQQETSALGQDALQLLEENAKIAACGKHPLCQDTGMVVLFLELGQEVRIVGGELNDGLQAAVRTACANARLRNSMCAHPLRRKNTGDNTPAMIHLELVPGEQLVIRILSKGSGSENASRLSMLLPSAGAEGISRMVLQTVRDNAPAACPPILVGIGVGGSFDSVALLAKKALLRPIGQAALDSEMAALEKNLLEKINQTGIGPQGWGGSQTALSVAIETAPCHIASLPVAVNIECHSHRASEVRL